MEITVDFSWSALFLCYFTYAFIGWAYESFIWAPLEKKEFLNRGFLIGPCCPIYGIIAILDYYCLFWIKNPLGIFFFAIFICCLFEYIVSFTFEKAFGERWWDYSKEKVNLNGRICIRTLIPFGIFGLIIVYILNPLLFSMIDMMSKKILAIVSWTSIGIMLIDFFISMNVVSKVTSTAKKMSRENPKDDTDEITTKVKKELKKSIAGKRLLNAFPDLKAFKIKIKEVAEKGKEALEHIKK